MRSTIAVALAAVAAARIGDGWGTNIHWTKETQTGEAAMLSKAFRLARMDFNWADVEKAGACGSYDFSSYDGLLAIMKANAVRPYWILDYGNACYPAAPGSPQQSCDTAACIQAFGRFAAAAVQHFKGNNIIFECLNEPNGMGGDNTTDITALCQAAGAPIQAAGEIFVGPTTAGMDWSYINGTFADGILSAFTSVSVHPYRNVPPDTVVDDWTTLRALIRQYAPQGKQDMDVISGEWGYTSALPPCSYGNRVDEATQAKYLARMWLSNILSGVATSIAYDWRDDGTNASDCESNFGSVRATPTGNASQPFTPKPFYTAALTLQTSLGEAQSFGGRVQPQDILSPVAQPKDVFALRFVVPSSPPFSTSSGVAWAVWTNATVNTTCSQPPPPALRFDCGYYGISEQQCSERQCCWEPNQPKVGGPQCYYGVQPVNGFLVTLPTAPAAPGTCWQGMDYLGNSLGGVCSDPSGTVTLQVSDGPVYLL